MQQYLQQNATMIAQLNYRWSPHPPQTQLLSYQFKPRHPHFPKWEGALPTTPLFLAQVDTYKAEVLYSRVDTNGTDKHIAQRRHQLGHAGFASVVDFIDVSQ